MAPLDPSSPPAIATKKLLFKIIWGALTFSLILYYFIATQVLGISGTRVPRDMGSLGQILPILAGLIALASLAVFQLALTGSKIEERSRKVGPARALSRAFPLYIVAWALNESICIFGLIISVFSFQGSRITPYFLAALALNLLMFPRVSKV